MTVRVRIAPAPSGSIHVGNARTALFNWLFAKQQSGTFIWRIEDTNQEKLREEAITSTAGELRWLGLEWDEGPFVGGPHAPYRQSERLALYASAVERLTAQGLTYRCYCTPEELAARRKESAERGVPSGYDGRCDRLTSERQRRNEREGLQWVLRFRTPDDGVTAFDDAITGPASFRNANLEDFPIMRESGFPLYNLSVAVDDAEMDITHVIRGLDIQSSTPRQILILRALGCMPPTYAHASLITGPGGQKLSKRTGGDSVAWYRERGYLPDAVVNYLALLGMAYGERTLLRRNELIRDFQLDHVNPASAYLDLQTLEWMNGEYIRRQEPSAHLSELTTRLLSDGVLSRPVGEDDLRKLAIIAPLVQTRIRTYGDAGLLCAPVFQPVNPRAAAAAKRLSAVVLEFARGTLKAIAAAPAWDRETIERLMRLEQRATQLTARTAFEVLYLAMTGSTVGLPVFDVMRAIGQRETAARLAAYLEATTGDQPPTGRSTPLDRGVPSATKLD